MKHVLMVAFHYPPEASSSGVLRTLKYTRYLPESGWRATVISPDVSAYGVVNDQLLAQIPDSVRVIRTKFLNTKRHLSIRGRYPAALAVPDSWIGWFPWAVSAGKRVLRADPPDLVYSTSPHPTAHLIAARLSRLGSLPFVTDFRDPWYEVPPEPGTPVVVAKAAKVLERRVVGMSDKVVASTYGLRDMLRHRYPNEPRGKITAILNGYDEEDFASVPEKPVQGSELVVVHAGNINREFRDPRPLFRAVAAAHRTGELNAEQIRFRFIGGGSFADSDELRQCVAESGLERQVEFLPRLPYGEALQALGAADVLLLLQASDDTRDLVPAKLYEYLRVQRPVLALVYDGAASEIMRETRGGWSVNPAHDNELRSALCAAFSAWHGNQLKDFAASPLALNRFERRALSRELAAVFNEVIQR